jgi:hypothetical protein
MGRSNHPKVGWWVSFDLCPVRRARVSVIIAVTVVLGLRQLYQLRQSTQLDGLMRVFDAFSDPQFVQARAFVFRELPQRMQDPQFAAEVRDFPPTNPAQHQEIVVLNFLNLVGSLIAQGAIDRDTIYLLVHYTAIRAWDVLKDVVQEHRASTDNPYMWLMAERLYQDAKEWVVRDARVRGLTRPSTGEAFRAEFLR